MPSVRKVWRAIGVQEKLHILIQGALLILFFVLMEWVVDHFEMQINRSAELRAEEAADGLINGMNMLMLTGQISNPDNRRLFIDKMSKSHGIYEVRMIRGEAVKEQYGPGLPEEQPLDAIDREVLATGKLVFEHSQAQDGRPLLRVVMPFIASENFRGTNCLSCHHTKLGGVNGAASVTIDLSVGRRQLEEIKDRLWIGHLVVQLLLVVLIMLFVRHVIVRNITRPVKKLQQAMAEIGHDMDLSRRTEVNAENPDIGEMAKSFNLLVDKLEVATDRLQLFAKMFENSGEAILITDEKRNILTVNPAFEQITGYSTEEVIGKNPKILSSGKQSEEFYGAMWETIEIAGKWSGEIWNRRKNGDIYPEWLSIAAVKNAKGGVINYISSFSDITKRKEAERRIEFLAHYDSLTKLPNRALFGDRLRRALLLADRNEYKVGLMFLDLDKFKEINDTLGHLAGDQLLQSVAERLRESVRASDTLCRQGGDEFLILIEGLESSAEVERIAAKIMQAMALPHQLGDVSRTVSFSIGAAMYPDDAEDDETLTRCADHAMYLAKESGRNNFKLYQRDES
ncbi:MAG: diguanylate cyclase [Sideroxydans sp.]|nr:diguanylate cyclase [Sideroxydans sp.]